MRSLTELSIDDLRTAGDAIETVIEFRENLPPGELLVMLAERFRDDIREVLKMKPPERAHCGQEIKALADLEAGALDRLTQAVDVLLGRFARFMEDPELTVQLGSLRGMLAKHQVSTP
jgi:hypothetical protein